MVWECELHNETVEVIDRIARELRVGSSTSQVRYPKTVLDRKSLLAVAEDKVRYRLNSYQKDNK